MNATAPKTPAPKARLTKALRILSRLVLLSLAAAAFTLLTSLYARSIRTPSPTPHGKHHRALAPKITELPEFFGEVILIAVCTVAGRLIFRLRLSPAPRRKTPLTLLDSND